MSRMFEQWIWFGVLVVWGLWSLSHTWYLGFRMSVVFGFSPSVRRKNESERRKAQRPMCCVIWVYFI